MNLQKILHEMETLGTEQNRKIYRRHGVTSEMYGLSFANLKKLAKSIKKNQSLAEEMWQTGNHDARILATMIAEPALCKKSLLESWVKELDNYVLTDAFSTLAVQTSDSIALMENWTSSEREWISACGWNILAHIAMKNKNLSIDYFTPFIKIIKSDIHSAPNRARYSMNNALIAIGVRNEDLQKLAVEAAQAIGKVDVDHGETGCKTPDAVNYIKKTVNRKKVRYNISL